MSKVRIVGGGLTGILAALEAHRLGCRDITLHERFDTLGGEDAPLVSHGLELRDEAVDFGPREGSVRRLLEWHGAAFEEHDIHHGSVNSASGGALVFAMGAAGPVLPGAERIGEAQGAALADRIRTYPESAAAPLARYCQWRLAAWLDQVHESAAAALGVDQVHARPLAALTARVSTPAGGMGGLYQACRRALTGLGVRIETPSLVSPLEAMSAAADGEIVIWAADPAALFKPLRLDAPAVIRNRVVSHIFEARYGGPTPFELRNFTACGVVDRLHIYETRRQTVVAAECIADIGEDDLRREIARLMAGFAGETLQLGERLLTSMRPRRSFPSVDRLQKLAALDLRLSQTCGAGFIGAWGPQGLAERQAEVRARLTQALKRAPRPAAAAA